MARPLSLVISKEPDTPSLDCRSGQGLSSISCAISIPIEAHSHAHCHAERVSPSLARLAKSDWCRHCGSGRMRTDRKSPRLNSRHSCAYRMPSSACTTKNHTITTETTTTHNRTKHNNSNQHHVT